jgi:hypothetical protein
LSGTSVKVEIRPAGAPILQEDTAELVDGTHDG